MASDLKLKRGTSAALITTDAAPGSATLASATLSAVSAEYDNSTNLCAYANFEVTVAFTTAPTAGKPLSLYLQPCLDGTNYVSTTVASVLHDQVGFCLVSGTTASQIRAFAGFDGSHEIKLPPSKFKVLIANDTDNQMGSQWKVTMYPYFWQST